jgi:importin subunit beta-1
MKPYCNEIVRAIVKTVLSSSLHCSLKPPLLSCFGNIALAITSEYESYLETSIKMLLHAAQTCVPDEDDDLIDYVRKLREGILEAFTSIFRGLTDGNRTDLLLTYVDGVFSSLEMVASDRKNDYDNVVLAKAVGLIRDITNSFGSRIKDQIQRTFVQQILHDGLATGDPDIVKNCKHTADQIAQILTPTFVGGSTDQ